MTARIQSLIALLENAGVDALLITDEINVRYLCGFTGDSSYLLVTPSSTTILTDRRYETQIVAECPDLTAAIRPPTQRMDELVVEVLGGTKLASIGFESDAVTVSVHQTIANRLAKAGLDKTLTPTSGLVDSLRMIKDAEEITTLRQAVDIAQRAYQSVVPRLKPKWTEREIAFELESVMRGLGADGVSFTPIVAAQPSGALPHYRPDDVAIGQTPTLLIDWGANYQGYASDLTRTLHTSDASPRFLDCYQLVLDAQLAAIAAIGDGVAANTVDAAARQVLEKAGLGDAFKHGLGHGVGLQIHESPRMAANSPEMLRSGMVITVEPGVYFENEFGIRIEDDVLVTDTGCEVLSTLGKGLDDCQLIL